MVLIETSFPRGGTVTKPVETSNIVFGARQDRKTFKKQSKKQKEENQTGKNEETEIEAISAELLSHKTIQEGMILMGSVKVVDPIFLKISLPGRILGKVVASKISDSYTKVLNKYVASSDSVENFQPLNEMYQIGQTVYAKVEEIKEIENGKLDINLSLKPSDIHSNMYHEKIRKGMIFNGAIEEIQEHGYVIETGVKNLRCFLPLEKAQSEYSIGQLIFMKVEKITQNPIASTVVCKALVGENRRIKDIVDPNLDYIVPCSVVHFTVEKILKDGLQGSIMNGTFKAYINEHQLHEPLANLDDFEVNSTLDARVLYTMPLTKLVYLSLNLNTFQEGQQVYQKGDIIEGATVHRIGTGGIILNLDGKCKGLISFKSIKVNYIGNYDQDEILAKYGQKTKLNVRVVDFDQMDSLYICTDNPNIVNEKFYTIADLKPGDFVTATILEKEKSGGYFVSIGNVRGLVEKLFLSSTSLHLQENSKLRCRVMAINPDRNIAYLTNRPEYMSKQCKLLTQISQAKQKKIFLGTVVKIYDNYLIIKFFNNIKGILYKSRITGFMAEQISSFYLGQIMSFRIVKNDDEKIILGLADDVYKVGEICFAKINSVISSGLDVVINDENQMKALVPTRLLSDFPELVNLHLKTYKPGDDLEIACVVKNIFSVRDVDHFTNDPPEIWKFVKPGQIIRAFIKNVDGDIVEIFLPLKDYNQIVKVHMKMFLEKAFKNANIVVYPDQVVYVKVLSIEHITKNITISAKLTEVWDFSLKTTANIFEKYINELKHIKESLKRDGNPMGNIELGEIVPAKVTGCDDETKDWFVELHNNVRGTIKRIFTEKKKVIEIGETLHCVVLWIDYLNEMVYLSHKPGERDHIKKDTKLPENFVKQIGINGKILIKTNDVIVCSLKKGQNPLVFVPTRLHYNDFENSIGNDVKEGEFCRLVFIHDKIPIAVFESTWKLWNSINNRKRKHSVTDENLALKKWKTDKPLVSMHKFTPLIAQGFPVGEVRITEDTSDDDGADNFKEILDDYEKEIEQNEEERNLIKLFDSMERKQKRKRANSETEIKKPANKNKKEKKPSDNDNIPVDSDAEKTCGEVIEDKKILKKKGHNITEEYKKDMIAEERKYKAEHKHIPIKPVLPGATGFWANDLESLTKNSENYKGEESSDDDGDTKKLIETKKKKKLTSAEKMRIAREEEARLRDIEEKYANPNMQPETADQFDRLVLANPNSSKVWIEYMVFHLTATEIDKARAVARKALKSISFREERELINIWVALLNLELRYGTKESFNETFKESLLSNDPFKIYCRVIQILTDAQKSQELTEIITTVTKKFREKPETWKIAANAYFDIGLPEKAKQLLHKALASLPERDHINTIVTFANLNHKHGDKETAHTLLEQILTSYPKRVDVWSQYVDMLIKDKEIESARRTLERAVIQKIPLKKMRTLFKKYLDFEEQHGTQENVQKVKELAANYVKKEISS